jgi:hypothetical protein
VRNDGDGLTETVFKWAPRSAGQTIFTTSEVLERLDAMPDGVLLPIVNKAFDEAEHNDDCKPCDPDRATFKALLIALTDDWPAA